MNRPAVRPASRPSVRLLTFASNDFSSETVSPIDLKLKRDIPYVIPFQLYANCAQISIFQFFKNFFQNFFKSVFQRNRLSDLHNI